MKPFERCTTTLPDTWKGYLALMRANGVPFKTRAEKKAVIANWRYCTRCVNFMNDTYHVAVDYQTEHGFAGAVIAHLSIKRHDREPMHDWRVLQEIKNLILGEDAEAIELYPKESRVVDTANQYHLYAFLSVDGVEFPMFPLGIAVGHKTDDPEFGKAKQRPRS